MKLTNICCIGAIFSGGISCSVIAYKCPEVRVTVVDTAEVISKWNEPELSFIEPELQQLVKKCRNRNLFFSTNCVDAIHDAQLIFIPYNVPIKMTMGGRKRVLNFKQIEEAAKIIAMHSESDKIVVEKSALSAKAAEKVLEVVKTSSRHPFRCHVLSNPEYVTRESTVNDLLNPSSIMIGCQKNPTNRAAAQMLSDLYEQWIPRENIIVLNHWSVEVSKMAENTFIAQNICSLNTLSMICEETGASFSEVTRIVYQNDPKQLKKIRATLGFGKFQKDISNFLLMCDSLNMKEVASYWESVLEMNKYQTERFLNKIKSILHPLQDKIITILGFSCEKNSIDTTSSPAITVCESLLKEKCYLRIYDPAVPAKDIEKALDVDFIQDRKTRVQILSDIHMAVLSYSSAIIICTDWNEFQTLDYSKLLKLMDTAIIFDGQNILNGESLIKMGIQYHGIGLGKMDLKKLTELSI